MNMKLSHRSTQIKPSATLAIGAKINQLRAQGETIIALNAGEPDFDTPLHIKATAIDAIHSGATRYTPVSGSVKLKNAIIEKFERENGLTYSPQEVIVSNGAKQCLSNGFLALLQAGDEVIIPGPYWTSYPEMVKLADGTPVIIETQQNQQYKITPSQLQKAITPQTRIVILNNPCNPTGMSYSKKELIALGDVLAKHPNIIIFCDEIYEHVIWQKDHQCSFAAACPKLKDRTLVVNGVSKTYAMTGWRIGYAGGPEYLIQAMNTIQSQATSCPCSISQRAACEALTGDQSCVDEMVTLYKQRHDYFISRLGLLNGLDVIPTDGTFYVFPETLNAEKRFGLSNDIEFTELLLEKTAIAVVPGSAFGCPHHVRMSICAHKQQLKDAADRLTKLLA